MTSQNNIEQDEIDLVALLAQIWQAKRLIILSTICFMIIGLMVALFSKVTFKSETTFVPQTNEKGGVNSSLSGLAAIAGINLGSADISNQIPPSLYPTILESTSFIKEFLNTTVNFNGDKILIKDYLSLNSSPGIISGLIKGIKAVFPSSEKSDKLDENFIFLDDLEYGLSKGLSKQLIVSINEKEGFVSLSMIDTDPVMAAVLNRTAFSLLQSTVINFKIENAKKLFDFVSEQYSEKQIEFEAIQKELALFQDRNKNISTAVFDSERQRLQTKYDLSYALYQELAKQKAQAELQLSKDTPIFSIIKPITPPKEKDAPKRALILVIYSFLGVVLSTGYVLIRKPVKEIVLQINKT